MLRHEFVVFLGCLVANDTDGYGVNAFCLHAAVFSQGLGCR